MLTMLCHVYPRAMIDISSANRRSRDILRAVMKDQRTKAQARAVYQKVGSRSFNSRRRKKSTSKLKSSRSIQSAQASLFDNIDLSA